MSEGVSDSRFNMWRAIMALILADGVVAPEEREFMRHYMDAISFSPQQRAVLSGDLSEVRDVPELFDKITDAEDRGQFFMFARMLIWCDGDLHAQEEAIFERLMSRHMEGFDTDVLRREVALTRDDSRLTRAIEDDAFKKQAEDRVSVPAIIKSLFKSV